MADKTFTIKEFLIEYRKTRQFLKSDIEKINNHLPDLDSFIDTLTIQFLLLWQLQKCGFFYRDTDYFISKFKEVKTERSVEKSSHYWNFLINFFSCEEKTTINGIHGGGESCQSFAIKPALLLTSSELKSVFIPNKCLYQEKLILPLEEADIGNGLPLFNLIDFFSSNSDIFDEHIIGSIFERFLDPTERKKQGAYYTPEEITSFISRKTLEPFLIARINGKIGQPYKTINQILNECDSIVLGNLFNELTILTILDPAVGSGDFLVSAINVLLSLYERIWRRSKEFAEEEIITIQTVTNDNLIVTIDLGKIEDVDQFRLMVLFYIILSKSIFGVDINARVIDVARARIFLILVRYLTLVDKHDLRLENFFINLKTGNSLVGYVLLSDRQLLPVIPNSEKTWINQRKILRKKLRSLEIPEIVEVEVSILQKVINSESISPTDLLTFLKVLGRIREIRAMCINSSLFPVVTSLVILLTDFFVKILDELFVQKKNLSRLEISSIGQFHWCSEFPEVFDRKNGFDIVVGNPPYVRADIDDKILVLQRELLKKSYETLFERWDLFLAFIERAVKDLTNKEGVLSFLVSDALCTVKYADKTRLWLASTFHIPRIDFFEDISAFNGVGIVPMILFVDKAHLPSKTLKVTHIGTFNQIKEKKVIDYRDPNLFKKSDNKILSYSYDSTVNYGDICYISYGLRPNADERISKGEFGKNDLISPVQTTIHIKRYVEGKDICRYGINKIRYLEWGTQRCPDKIARRTFPELYIGEKIFRGTLVGGVIIFNEILCNHSIVVFKRFIDLKGVTNRSIFQSIKKFNTLSRDKLEKISQGFQYEYLLAILNSTFAFQYLNGIRRHKLKNYFYPDDFRQLPIKIVPNQKVFVQLVRIIQFLYQINQSLADFFDKEVLDLLVYELYFQKVLFSKKMSTNASQNLFHEIVSKHFLRINLGNLEDHYLNTVDRNKITKDEELDKSEDTQETLEVLIRLKRSLKNNNQFQCRQSLLKSFVKSLKF